MNDREIGSLLAVHRHGLADIRRRILDFRQDVRDDRVTGPVGVLARAAEPVIERLSATTNDGEVWAGDDVRGALQAVEAALSQVVEVGWTWRRLVKDPSLSESAREHAEQLAELQIDLRDHLEHLEVDLRRQLASGEAE